MTTTVTTPTPTPAPAPTPVRLFILKQTTARVLVTSQATAGVGVGVVTTVQQGSSEGLRDAGKGGAAREINQETPVIEVIASVDVGGHCLCECRLSLTGGACAIDTCVCMCVYACM